MPVLLYFYPPEDAHFTNCTHLWCFIFVSIGGFEALFRGGKPTKPPVATGLHNEAALISEEIIACHLHFAYVGH